jgi:hypothetical protein
VADKVDRLLTLTSSYSVGIDLVLKPPRTPSPLYDVLDDVLVDVVDYVPTTPLSFLAVFIVVVRSLTTSPIP